MSLDEMEFNKFMKVMRPIERGELDGGCGDVDHHHCRKGGRYTTPIVDECVGVVGVVSTPTTMTIPGTVKDLRKIAKERGIKYSTTMTKKDLCTVLGVEVVKPLKLVLRNKSTGEEHGFHSIYKASKDMSVNPGLLHYYIGKDMRVDGVVYAVSKWSGN